MGNMFTVFRTPPLPKKLWEISKVFGSLAGEGITEIDKPLILENWVV